jgi:hypothetical protein
VTLWLWWEWSVAQRVHEAAEGAAVGTGRKRFPPEWIELLEENERERAQWRHDEYHKSK